ncbi:IPT/TIG domain-containing protein [Bacteroides bouchesdurhonensis]|uniref:IPT/TIG domain-containing protein n=1 Tax=Bacteroides bouchesdurhonensis TaxID=1841855 RepID=UPI00097F9D2E|nr:IPT/TIG domain-containing protein [Bacteroides bouchesdurhonensis]
MKKKTKSNVWHIQWMLLAFVTLCFTGCKDDNEDQGEAFDPNKPIVISDFSEKKGGVGNNLILYGDNFGNDISKVKVTIGGKDARIITVKNKSMYCIIPPKAYNGDIHVSALDDNGQVISSAEAESTFEYEKKWMVSTAFGTHYENSNEFFDMKDGSLDAGGGFGNVFWFSWDPLSDYNKLYFTNDGKTTRYLDLEKNEIGTFSHGFDRVTAMTWTLDGDLILSHNHSSDTRTANYLYTRESNYSTRETLGGYARGVNGSMVHPINGEFYYSRYRAGDMWKYDFETGESSLCFQNPYSGVAIYLVPHPSGNYAYMLEQEFYFIMRTDYDWISRTFTTPYAICGTGNAWGYSDGIGTHAQLNRPIQGVFVKNPDYAGRDDEYDFYFCDKNNHCVRILTPTGRVTTFAGRGNNGTSGLFDGEVRTEARFNEPRALTFDPKRNCFYVGDGLNKIIRKIAKETE